MPSHVVQLSKNLNKAFLDLKTNADLRKKIALIKKKLDFENGFVVIKGIKIKNQNLEETIKSYLFLMQKLGKILPQNKKREKIVRVENLGKSWSANNRGYKTKDNINFHSDGGTYAGLMCIRKPKSGGANLITDSKKIYDYFKDKHPNFLKVLEKGFHYHTRGENRGTKHITKKKYPVFYKKNNLVHCMFNKNPIIWAYKNITFPKNQKKEVFKILNLVEKVSNIKKNITSLKLNVGDILLVNNYKVLHARKKFTDRKNKKRLFLRAWVKSQKNRYTGPTLLDVYNNK